MRVNERNSAIIKSIVAAAVAAAIVVNYPIAGVRARSVTPTPTATSRSVSALGTSALAVNPVLDSARQVSATMSEEGGTLSTTAVNGTVFTLTIPKDALAGEEEITMTPVVAIADLPFSGGLAGGGAVKLEPEGLLLLQPATLELKPATALSIQEQTPFSWYKSGEDFHLFPLATDVTAIRMNVTTFNGYGVGSAAPNERAALLSQSPSRADARFEQQIEQASDDTRQKLTQDLTKKQIKKANKKFNAEVLQELISAFNDLLDSLKHDSGTSQGAVVESRLQPSDFLSDAVRCDLVHTLAYLAVMRGFGLTLADVDEPNLPAQVKNSLQGLESIYAEACADGNLGAIGDLLGLAKMAEKFATMDPLLSDLSSVATEIYNDAINCAHLKLTFDSTLQSVFSLIQAVDYTIQLEATDVPLSPVIDKKGFHGKFTGSAPLVHHIDTLSTNTNCSVTNSSTDSTLNIISLEFDLKLRQPNCPGADPTPPTDFDLLVDVGMPREQFTISCPNEVIYHNTTADTWRAQFFCEHYQIAEHNSATQFRFRNWNGSNSTHLGIKIYDNVVPAACPAFKETTFIFVDNASQ